MAHTLSADDAFIGILHSSLPSKYDILFAFYLLFFDVLTHIY